MASFTSNGRHELNQLEQWKGTLNALTSDKRHCNFHIKSLQCSKSLHFQNISSEDDEELKEVFICSLQKVAGKPGKNIHLTFRLSKSFLKTLTSTFRMTRPQWRPDDTNNTMQTKK